MQKFGEGLRWPVNLPRSDKLIRRLSRYAGILSNLHLFVVEMHAGEVVGEPCVEPTLRRRIVVLQKHQGKLPRSRAPAVVLKKVENDVIAVLARKVKPWFHGCCALGRDLRIFLVGLESDDLKRFREIDARFQQKFGEHGSHL